MKHRLKKQSGNRVRRLAMAAFLVVPAAFSSAQVVATGFETTDGGYTPGGSLVNVSDTATGGATWASPSGITASTAHPFAGGQALRISKGTTTAAFGSSLNIVNSAALLNAPFRFQISFSVNSVSAATGNQVWVLYGNNFTGNNSHWVRINYDDGTLRLYTANGSGGNYVGVNLGAYTTYSALGDYVTFDLTVDPVTKTYTDVSVAGTLFSANLTSAVTATNGGTVPWSSAVGAPGTTLGLLIGTNDTGVVDFDAFSVSAIPEPSSFAAGAGVFAVAAAGSRRRRRISCQSSE